MVVRLVPGKDTKLMADYHNPYDTELQRYKLITTEEEVAKGLDNGVILHSENYNRNFKIINISPDETGWAVIQASWEGDNINA